MRVAVSRASTRQEYSRSDGAVPRRRGYASGARARAQRRRSERNARAVSRSRAARGPRSRPARPAGRRAARARSEPRSAAAAEIPSPGRPREARSRAPTRGSRRSPRACVPRSETSRRGPPCSAEVGIESTDAGCASVLHSETSAAAVTCAIMRPELSPPFSTRNAGQLRGRRDSCSFSMRRSEIDARSVAAIAA